MYQFDALTEIQLRRLHQERLEKRLQTYQLIHEASLDESDAFAPIRTAATRAFAFVATKLHRPNPTQSRPTTPKHTGLAA